MVYLPYAILYSTYILTFHNGIKLYTISQDFDLVVVIKLPKIVRMNYMHNLMVRSIWLMFESIFDICLLLSPFIIQHGPILWVRGIDAMSHLKEYSPMTLCKISKQLGRCLGSQLIIWPIRVFMAGRPRHWWLPTFSTASKSAFLARVCPTSTKFNINYEHI